MARDSNEDLTYVAGKMNNFTIRVDKKENTGQYTLTLISESITPWENDLVSHDADAREYIIINSTAGHLKDSIIAANKDYTQVKNLKITGRINSQDFYFMRDSMDNLQALNLKEVSVSGGFNDYDYYNYFNTQDSEEEIEGMIPSLAFQYKKSLIRIVLPDKLTGIGYDAFSECDNLTGSIIIPEGTTRIAREAFYGCYSLDGSLSLPSTLEYIGTFAFSNCKFSCELILPNELRYIGNYAFNNGTFYGNLVLPHELEYIGEYAFLNCADITGNLSIPQKIKNISNGTFQSSGFDGTLTLHDGIIAIGSTAFANTNLKGNLILPKDLTTIGISAFDGCNFSGNLIFPKELVTINNNAFVGNTRISGTIEFPESMSTIGAKLLWHWLHRLQRRNASTSRKRSV